MPMIWRGRVLCIVFFLILSLIMPVHAYVPAGTAIGDYGGVAPSEWVMVPVSDLTIHVGQGQSIFSVLAPFFAITILGFLLVVRREGRKGVTHHQGFWIATVAGLCYLGGAAVTLVQMVRTLIMSGFSNGVIVPLTFALITIALSMAALRFARTPEPWPVKVRITFGIIAGLGIIFWSGVLIGPALAMTAAIIPNGRPAILKSP